MSADPLARLRARFRQRCEEDLATLRLLLNQDASVRHEPLRMVAHGLSGIAGSFGYGSLSALAGDIDYDLTRDRRVADERVSELVTTLEWTLRESLESDQA
ncbi:MAG: Hpt domain-containing protein [Alphaproteobacteria bacterium]|nr:Hpt domain-containing protein [Alphaproteobacteria bacterium]